MLTMMCPLVLGQTQSGCPPSCLNMVTSTFQIQKSTGDVKMFLQSFDTDNTSEFAELVT